MSVVLPFPRLRLFAVPLATALLAGCASVGPTWHGAPVAAPNAAARVQFLRAPADANADAPAPRWWEALGDPALNDLETRALSGSPDLAAAQARIANARAMLNNARSTLAPTVGVGAVAGVVSLPGALLGRNGRLTEEVYGENLQASWEIDLFGAKRRRIESARDKAEAIEASAADVAVALSAQVAQTYVQFRTEQTTAAVLARQVELDRTLLVAAQARFAGGTAPAQSIDTAKSALAQSESDLSDSHAHSVVLADQLAVLIGSEPGSLDNLLAASGAIPAVPAQVAVGDPANLLRHRPDIRAAERQLAAATADVGARMADRFPSVSFTGILGFGGTNPGEAFNPATLIGLIVPQIKWNAFDGGRAAALVNSARSARDEAEATYRSRVLAALDDAENALTRFGAQRIALGKAMEQSQAAAHLAGLQAMRAAGGTLSQADALTSKRQALRAQLATASAQARLTSDFITVEKALGLGWDTGEARK